MRLVLFLVIEEEGILDLEFINLRKRACHNIDIDFSEGK